MNAFDYLKTLPRQWLPRKPSNSELFRWLRNKSVMINNEYPKPKDELSFPIKNIVFFKGEKRVTFYEAQ